MSTCYDLQVYFGSLCRSFYKAYSVVKRIEAEEDEIEEQNPKEELEAVESYMKLTSSVEKYEMAKNYIQFKLSQEEMIKKINELREKVADCEKKNAELKENLIFWSSRMRNMKDEIYKIIIQMTRENSKIVIINEEEIMALLYVFRENDFTKLQVVSLDDVDLTGYPTGKQLYVDFLEAYKSMNQNNMATVWRKYI